MDSIKTGGPRSLLAVEGEDRSRLLAMAVAQSSEGIAIVDLDGNLLYVNEAFAGMHGYSADEIIGKPLAIFHTAGQLDSVNSANRQIKETGEFRGEIWHVKRDGTVFPTVMHNTLIRDEAGLPVGMLGTMRDVSELKGAQVTLVESEQKFATAFMASPVVLAISTLEEGRIIEVNRSFEKVTGYSRSEALGRTTQDLKIWVLPGQRDELLGQLKSHGIVHALEIQMRTKKGDVITGLISSRVFHANGKPCMLSQLLDISDRKQMEQELHDAKRLLEKRVAERTQELSMKTKALEEMNTALRVLLAKGESDSSALEEKMQLNIESTVLPFLRKIKTRRLDSEQAAYLAVVESNLRLITSSFSQTMSSDLIGLSPSELKVATLVKLGYSTKQISQNLIVSPKTVDVHRLNIRKKLGIAGQPINLRKYLQGKITLTP